MRFIVVKACLWTKLRRSIYIRRAEHLNGNFGKDVTWSWGKTENIIRSSKFGGGARHPSLSSRLFALTFINIALRAARAGYALSPSTPLSVLDSIICHGLLGQSWNYRTRTTGTTLNSSLTDRLRSSPKNWNERRAPEGETRACPLILNIYCVCLDRKTWVMGCLGLFLCHWMYSKTFE